MKKKRITSTLNLIGMKSNEKFTEELKKYRQDITFLKANKTVSYKR